MRLFLLSALLVSAVWGDFYIVNGDEQVRMEELPGGKVDFAALAQIPVVRKPKKGLHVRSDTEGFNHKHLNFRTATINLRQTNVVLTEYSSESEKPGVYDIRFGDVEFDEGVMLQLFYHNHWYGAVIGDPLAILHALFDDTAADPQKAFDAVTAARKAFPDDPELSKYEKVWEKKAYLARQHARAEQIRQTYALYLGTKSPGSKKFYAAQTRSEIEAFFKEFPDSPLKPSLTELLETLE
jgi:hypothetical protein